MEPVIEVIENVLGKKGGTFALTTLINKHQEIRFEKFLHCLDQNEISEQQVAAYIDDEAQSLVFEKAVEIFMKNSSEISRFAMTIILADQVRGSGRYSTYNAPQALELLRNLDDIDARLLIVWITASTAAYSDVSARLSVRPLAVRSNLPVEWKDFEGYMSFLPSSIRSGYDLKEAQHRFVQRGIFGMLVGFTDGDGANVDIGELSLLLVEDLKKAARLCKFEVP